MAYFSFAGFGDIILFFGKILLEEGRPFCDNLVLEYKRGASLNGHNATPLYAAAPGSGSQISRSVYPRPLLLPRLFPLLCVITLQQLAALAVNMAGNMMPGAYTGLALSGATLVNQIQFTLQQIAAGIGMGIVVLASQYWGQGRTEPIKQIISIGVKFALVVGLLFFLLSSLFPVEILSLFTSDQAVIAEGVRYLRIICWTYLVFSVSNSLMYSLQSVETAMIGTVMSLSTICINAALNDCLIYGNFGAPELGVAGAALATLVSRIAEVYAVSADTKALAVRFLTVLSVTTVGTCYEYPVESGIITDGGVTKYAAWADNLFMWLFTIPAALLSAFVFSFPPVVTFCFLKADQILKCIPNAFTCNRYRWVRVLTRGASQSPDSPALDTLE